MRPLVVQETRGNRIFVGAVIMLGAVLALVLCVGAALEGEAELWLLAGLGGFGVVFLPVGGHTLYRGIKRRVVLRADEAGVYDGTVQPELFIPWANIHHFDIKPSMDVPKLVLCFNSPVAYPKKQVGERLIGLSSCEPGRDEAYAALKAMLAASKRGQAES